MNKKSILILAIIVILIIFSGGCQNINNLKTLHETTSPSSEPTPVSPSPANSPIIEPEVNSEENEYISGILSADIKLNFEEFEFTGPRDVDEIDIDTGKMSKNDIMYEIDIFGELPFKVHSVQFFIDCSSLAGLKSEEKIKSYLLTYLDYCSSLPYDNAEPEKAAKWINDNIINVTSDTPIQTSIGNVYMALCGNYPYVMSLEISVDSILE